MRKLFTLLTMCLLASTAWATVITFDATVDVGTGSGTAAPYTIVKEAEGVKVTIEVSKGMANGSQYRIYKGETMTVKAEGGDITNIDITCTANGDAQYGPGCFTSNIPEYNYKDKVGTWTGATGAVVFTAATNQVRATLIQVTVGAAGLAAPTFTPAPTEAPAATAAPDPGPKTAEQRVNFLFAALGAGLAVIGLAAGLAIRRRRR